MTIKYFLEFYFPNFTRSSSCQYNNWNMPFGLTGLSEEEKARSMTALGLRMYE